MFIDNKYTKWYNSIIAHARLRPATSDYVEKHHIIPTCLGGTNKKENIIPLSPREHFICHLLLTKMTTGQARYKMGFALSMLSNVKNIGEGRYVVTGNTYEYARKLFKESLDNFWTSENREIHAKKISAATIGKKVSEETKEKHRNRNWSEKAKDNRLSNCLTSAAKRKGVKNPAHGKRVFHKYVEKNSELIKQIWELYEQGINRRQIALHLGITWDRVGLAINRKEDILKEMQ